MRSTIRLFVVLALMIVSTAASGQEQTGATRARQGGLAERFRQLDRNGDGKISAEEFPGPLFTQMDKDGDGFVTLEEAQAYFAARRKSPPGAKLPGPSEQPPADSPKGGDLQVVDAVFELCVRDVEACARFYRDGIGMREVEPAQAEKGALLEWAGSYLRLRKVAGTKAGTRNGQSDEADALDERLPVVLALVQRSRGRRRAACQSRLPGPDEGRQRQHDARSRRQRRRDHGRAAQRVG